MTEELSLTIRALQALETSDPETTEFRLLFLLFLAGFTLVMLVSGLPRRVRPDYVSPVLLRAFAQSKGLVPLGREPTGPTPAPSAAVAGSRPILRRPARHGAASSIAARSRGSRSRSTRRGAGDTPPMPGRVAPICDWRCNGPMHPATWSCARAACLTRSEGGQV